MPKKKIEQHSYSMYEASINWEDNIPESISSFIKMVEERESVNEEILNGNIDYGQIYATYGHSVDDKSEYKPISIGYFHKMMYAKHSRKTGDWIFNDPRKLEKSFVGEVNVHTHVLKKPERKRILAGYSYDRRQKGIKLKKMQEYLQGDSVYFQKIVKVNTEEIKKIHEEAKKSGLFELIFEDSF